MTPAARVIYVAGFLELCGLTLYLLIAERNATAMLSLDILIVHALLFGRTWRWLQAAIEAVRARDLPALRISKSAIVYALSHLLLGPLIAFDLLGD